MITINNEKTRVDFGSQLKYFNVTEVLWLIAFLFDGKECVFQPTKFFFDAQPFDALRTKVA
ncbi:MAG: hypothetical protein D3M94_21570 [Rhodocyclales bacterium GT-UBC]|nr:MAG: hypothetical protein D3M94_21570 [Rhodocyclales bacterium GT-UBC]